MIKVLITAPKGKMDKLIVEEAIKHPDIEVVGGIGAKGRDYIGKDIGEVIGTNPCNALVYDDLESVIDKCDVVIDYSTVEVSMEVLKSCLKHKKAYICGTTGFNDEQNNEFVEASKEIAIIKAANTSYMVTLMSNLLQIAAKALADKCKIDIIDLHDEFKKDAPSGTAKELAQAMAYASNKSIDDINFHSVRAGDISSTHNVIFGGFGERLEITHHAYNWRCYAVGACEAAIYIYGKDPGMYTMQNVISND